jgi:3-methyl-2-oxobutanoate hydroxymethyltransferase
MIRPTKKVRVPDFALIKERGERIVMLTAYDATMATLLDRAGIDLLLVGDSLANVILGLDTTIPVTLDAVIHHTRAVTRGASRALVVADMPFLTYQVSAEVVRQYAQLGELIFDAARNYANDVRERVYPQSAAARRNGAPSLVGK